MGNFCPSCGAPVKNNAKFCPECGTPYEIGIPKQNNKLICEYCGSPLKPGQKICEACGGTVELPASSVLQPENPGIRTDAPQPVPPAKAPINRTQAFVQNRAAVKAEAVKPKKKAKGKRVLCWLLAGVLLFTAFIKPGFATKYIKDIQNGKSGNIGTQTSKTPSSGANVSTSGGKQEIPGTNEGTPGNYSNKSPEISIRYTENDYKKAVTKSTEVGPENSSIECNGIQINFNEWNLSENDTLTVSELPIKTDKTAGVELRSFDLSLASGKHEFLTDVEVRIPRLEGDSDYDCIWFNEETNQWEPIYSEISDDGKYHIIYTNHFSTGAIQKEIQPADLSKLTNVKKLSESSLLSANVFALDPNDSLFNASPDAAMQRKVKVYPSHLHQIIAKNLAQIDSDVNSALGEMALNNNTTKNLGLFGQILGVRDVGKGAIDAYNAAGIFEKAAAGSVSFLDKSFYGLSWAILIGRIYVEVSDGATWDQAVMNHSLDIFSTAVIGTAGLLIGGWAIPVVSVLLWGYSEYNGGILSNLFDYEAQNIDVTWEWYQRFYANITYRQPLYHAFKFYESPLDLSNVITIQKPASVSASDWDFITKDIQNSDLSYAALVRGKNATLDEQNLQNTTTPKYELDPWVILIKNIFELYGVDHPNKVLPLIDEVYTAYAEVIWRTNSSAVFNFFLSERLDSRSDAEKIVSCIYEYREIMTKRMVASLYYYSANIIEAVSKTDYHREYEEMLKYLNTNTVPLLNTKLNFYVKDTSLGKNDKCSDSIYAVNYKTLNDKSVTDSNKLIAPIRFNVGDTPLFAPLAIQGLELRDTYNQYYPSTHSNIPCYTGLEKDGAFHVFSCTYYHYLMMGAPTEMTFYNLQEKDENGKYIQKTVSFEIPKFDGKLPDSEVDIVVSVTGKEPEKDALALDFGYVISDCAISTGILYYDSMVNTIEEALKDSRITISADGNITLQNFRTAAGTNPNNKRSHNEVSAFEINGKINRTTGTGTAEISYTIKDILDNETYENVHKESWGTFVTSGYNSSSLTYKFTGILDVTLSTDDHGTYNLSLSTPNGIHGRETGSIVSVETLHRPDGTSDTNDQSEQVDKEFENVSISLSYNLYP